MGQTERIAASLFLEAVEAQLVGDVVELERHLVKIGLLVADVEQRGPERIALVLLA
jgi:hypothetical protein